MINIACLEVYYIMIEDASANAWRCAALSPMARHRIDTIYSKMTWKDFHFDLIKEKDGKCHCLNM